MTFGWKDGQNFWRKFNEKVESLLSSFIAIIAVGIYISMLLLKDRIATNRCWSAERSERATLLA